MAPHVGAWALVWPSHSRPGALNDPTQHLIPQSTGAGNRQQQEEEICALQSIYGEEALAATDEHSYRVCVPEDGGAHLTLAFYLPETYPSHTPPLLELCSDFLPGGVLEQLSRELEDAFLPGGPSPTEPELLYSLGAAIARLADCMGSQPGDASMI
jgi:hypothetical protein